MKNDKTGVVMRSDTIGFGQQVTNVHSGRLQDRRIDQRCLVTSDVVMNSVQFQRPLSLRERAKIREEPRRVGRPLGRSGRGSTARRFECHGAATA